MGRRSKRKGSIILQVVILFTICVILTGLLTHTSHYVNSVKKVTLETEDQAEIMAQEAISAVHDYPAYDWLLTYWYEHAEQLDVEYDVDRNTGKKTEEKCRILREHEPGLQIDYAGRAEIEALSAEDQKLYAEIVYSWLITQVNQIKRAHHADYLFLVQTEEPYDRQFFLFSAADPGAVRGTEYEQVYPLGVMVEVSGDQQEAMSSAIAHASHVAPAGKYIDYYAYMDTIGKYEYLVGITYDQSAKLADVRSRTIYETMITMGCLILLSLLCSVGILFYVLKPLKKVQSNIRLYKDTKDSAPVIADLEKVRMNNEIGELSSDVIHLTREIDDYLEKIKVITADKEKIQAELSLAEHIQTSMLPHDFPPFPDRHEFAIFADMDPARAVGGDFYDFFLVDEDHLCMVIADVAGKGIPAALVMMMSTIIIKNSAMLGQPAAEVLKSANYALCDRNQTDMFVTAWIGILEISTGKLTAANAGHEYPAVRQPGGRYELLKDKHGFVIGGYRETEYQEYELQLEPGSKIFLYTDGVPEATDADEQLFGNDRMLQALNSKPDLDPENTLKNMRRWVDDFVKDAEQFDDLTMLCLEYRGTSR